MQRCAILCLAVTTAIVFGCGRVEPVPNASKQRASGIAEDVSAVVTAPLTTLPLPVAGSVDSTSPEVATYSAEVVSGDWFHNVTHQSGIRFANQNGRNSGRFLMIESFGGGTAVLDFDRDADADLFFTGGGTISVESPLKIAGVSSALFRNQGKLQFADVSKVSGVSIPADYSQGCAFGDFNTDGFPDVVVCAFGRSRLYSNLGDGTFAEAADENQLPAWGWGTAAAFADIDQDGFPDLFVACYTDWTPETDIHCFGRNQERDLCGPTSYAGTTCQLFHNNADGSFEDWSRYAALKGNVHGLGVVATDLNGDGLVDFYVSSDALPNQLYLGSDTLPLVECGESAGVALGEWGHSDASMGIDVADFDGNSLPDLFVTNFENEDNALYRNIGGGLWMHATVATGLSGVSRMNVGFGTSMVDFDGDGWADIFVVNGNPIYTTAISPFAQQPQLFRNIAGQRFEDVSQRGGAWFSEKHSGRGSTVGDLDDDGGLDLITVPMNEPIQILRNCRTPENYVTVQLRTRQGDPDAVGACVVTTFSGRNLTQWIVHGSGFFSQRDERLIFPVDRDISVTAVSVSWPGRSKEVFRGLATRQMHFLVEGRGTHVDGSP